jgi:hypothetical protein
MGKDQLADQRLLRVDGALGGFGDLSDTARAGR